MYAWGLKFPVLSPGCVMVGCMKMLKASIKCGRSYRFIHLFDEQCPLQISVLCHSTSIFSEKYWSNMFKSMKNHFLPKNMFCPIMHTFYFYIPNVLFGSSIL